jgi:hypothetical protein
MRIPRWVKSLKMIFKPSYWHKIYGYDEIWDDELQTLMAMHRFEPLLKYNGDVNTHYCRLGNVVIWIENHPYASYTRCGHIRDYPLGVSPLGHRLSRLTTYEAHTKRKRDFKYYEERKLREEKLNKGDGISPKKIKLKNELLEWESY